VNEQKATVRAKRRAPEDVVETGVVLIEKNLIAALLE
jgi:hypothetical protein